MASTLGSFSFMVVRGSNRDEISGFRKGAPEGTTVAGIQIYRPNDLKLYREGRRAVLRGLALEVDERNAFLWTSGYVPKTLDLSRPGSANAIASPARVRRMSR